MSTDQTRLGPLNETAPTSDTAPSGLNGRLQRIAQSLSARAGTAINTGSVTVAATAGGTLICAARSNRRKITIVSNGAASYFIGNTGVTTSTGVKTLAQDGYQVTLETTAAIYGITASGNLAVSFIEIYDA